MDAASPYQHQEHLKITLNETVVNELVNFSTKTSLDLFTE
jgi:hypothetical protein